MKDIIARAERYRVNCAISSKAHHIKSEKDAVKNQILGVLVVITTAVIGTTIFATLESDPNLKWKIFAGILSLLATVLSALQTFLKYSDQAERHKLAGNRYAALRRDIDIFLLKYAGKDPAERITDRQAAIKDLEAYHKKLLRAAEESPNVPKKITKIAKEELQEWFKELITFGLKPDEVKPEKLKNGEKN